MSAFSRFSVTAIGAGSAPGEYLASTTIGMIRSSDGGVTWKLPFEQAPLLTVVRPRDPSHPDLLCAGRAGGVTVSNDGGRTWHDVLASSPVGAISGATDSRGDLVVLAGTERDGIYRSIDRGRTWSPALAGLRDLEVLCIEPSSRFGEDNTAYAGTANGLHRSRNAGKAWRPVPMGISGDAVQAVALSGDASIVWVGTESNGLHVSHDEGTTWDMCTDLGRCAIGAIAITEGDVFVATDSAVWMRAAGQAAWNVLVEADGVLCLKPVGPRAVLVGLSDREICLLTERATGWVLETCRIVPDEDAPGSTT